MGTRVNSMELLQGRSRIWAVAAHLTGDTAQSRLKRTGHRLSEESTSALGARSSIGEWLELKLHAREAAQLFRQPCGASAWHLEHCHAGTCCLAGFHLSVTLRRRNRHACGPPDTLASLDPASKDESRTPRAEAKQKDEQHSLKHASIGRFHEGSVSRVLAT